MPHGIGQDDRKKTNANQIGNEISIANKGQNKDFAALGVAAVGCEYRLRNRKSMVCSGLDGSFAY